MSEMILELFVGGLLLYGLALLVFAALRSSSNGRSADRTEQRDAPIFVTRRSGRSTYSTASTRTGVTRTPTGVDVI
jgi:hypothetical protein